MHRWLLQLFCVQTDAAFLPCGFYAGGIPQYSWDILVWHKPEYSTTYTILVCHSGVWPQGKGLMGGVTWRGKGLQRVVRGCSER